MKITVTLAGIKTTQFAAGSANRNNEYYFESARSPSHHLGPCCIDSGQCSPLLSLVNLMPLCHKDQLGHSNAQRVLACSAISLWHKDK